MANNRMYLKCEQCGGTMLLSKRFHGPYRQAPSGIEMFSWLQDHARCGPKLDNFVIEYECERDYDEPRSQDD